MSSKCGSQFSWWLWPLQGWSHELQSTSNVSLPQSAAFVPSRAQRSQCVTETMGARATPRSVVESGVASSYHSDRQSTLSLSSLAHRFQATTHIHELDSSFKSCPGVLHGVPSSLGCGPVGALPPLTPVTNNTKFISPMQVWGQPAVWVAQGLWPTM